MNNKRLLRASVALMLAVLPFASCRKGEFVLPSTSIEVGGGDSGGDIKGFFLLNEGNMGSNKASLDYYDYETGIYHVNIYAERNPGVVYELGDVGNDIQIYGNKLYAVINCSNLVEVMDVATARRGSHRLHTQLPLHRLSGRLCLCKLLCRPGQDRPHRPAGIRGQGRHRDNADSGHLYGRLPAGGDGHRGQQTLRGQLRRLPGSQLRPDGFRSST